MILKACRLEFYKTRRKHIGLILLALIAFQFLWCHTAFLRWHGPSKTEENFWFYLFYQLTQLNCIIMPFAAAIIASRLADIEHKGSTFKLLHTLQPPVRALNAKLICGIIYMAAAGLLQSGLTLAIAAIHGFLTPVPWSLLVSFWITAFLVTAALYLLQMILSLLFFNQLIPLTIGLLGGFLGLMGLFFPTGIQRLFITSYYALLGTVRMDWNPETGGMSFYQIPADLPGVISLIAVFIIIYSIGRHLYLKKDV